MEVTIAICTYKRPGGVESALESLSKQTYRLGAISVLIIDNDPETSLAYHQKIAETFSNRFPVTVVAEPRLGISNARNRALNECGSSHIAFLDDDCIASPNWLAALTKAILSMGEGVGAVGGRSLGIWAFEMPAWVSRSLLGYLSVTDWGPTRRLLTPPLYLVGGNALFVARALRDAGGFDLKLGRLGSTLLGNEEIEVCDRLRGAGYSVMYEPEAIVGHVIARDRVQKAWFRKRVFWQAVSDLIQKGIGAAECSQADVQDSEIGCYDGLRDIHSSFEGELKTIYKMVLTMACGTSQFKLDRSKDWGPDRNDLVSKQ